MYSKGNLYNYYCDESSHLENDRKQYMVIGYISIPYSRVSKAKERIKELREKHKNSFEIKWTNIGNWNYKFYAELVDFIFDSESISFRAIIVDKNKYISEKCNNDYDRFYYLMYYQLLYHKLDLFKKYNIYLDIKDDLSQYRINELKKILNIGMGAIAKIQHVRSHEVELLQLCDLIIGAIAYKLNYPNGAVTAKRKLIELIEKNCGSPIDQQTPKYENKFNVFRIRL